MITKLQLNELDTTLAKCSGEFQELHIVVERILNSQVRLILPDQLKKYDPDPEGYFEFTDQRRLDVTFEEFLKDFESKLRVLMKV